MNRREIDYFFRVFAKSYARPCRIFLTGAGAGAVMGHIRATMDLDFAVRLKRRAKDKKEAIWAEFSKAVNQVMLDTGIAVQYAEDIDRWSSITYLDYDKHTLPYKRFGGVEVRLLAPAYWAIGKLTRYLDPDVRDLVEVLRRNNVSWKPACQIWGKALRRSPKSTACELFRRQVENFLVSYGRRIWGRPFVPEKAIGLFRQAAGIKIET